MPDTTRTDPKKQSSWEQLQEWGDRLAGGPAAFPVLATPGDRTISKPAAWAVLLGLFTLFFGQGTYFALRTLFSGEAPQEKVWDVQRNLESAFLSLSEVVLITVVSIFILRWLRVSTYRAGLLRPFSWESVKFESRIGCISQLTVVLGFISAGILARIFRAETPSFPWADMQEDLNWASDLASSFSAGPVEELLLVLLLVWLLRAAGHSWLAICIAAVALRIVFHTYYGWTSVGMIIWPLLVIYLYKRTGAIWGIIAAHSLFDLMETLYVWADNAELPGLSGLFLLLKVTPAIIGLLYVYQTSSIPKRNDIPTLK